MWPLICEDGLFWRGTSLQTPTLYLDLISGFWEPAEVSGQPVLIPGVPGYYIPANSFEKRRRLVQLEGFTLGAGVEHDERQTSWATANATLSALLDRTLGVGELVIMPPYLGQTVDWTLNARVLNAVTSPPEGRATRQRWSIQLESVDDEPEWVAGSPGS